MQCGSVADGPHFKDQTRSVSQAKLRDERPIRASKETSAAATADIEHQPLPAFQQEEAAMVSAMLVDNDLIVEANPVHDKQRRTTFWWLLVIVLAEAGGVVGGARLVNLNRRQRLCQPQSLTNVVST